MSINSNSAVTVEALWDLYRATKSVHKTGLAVGMHGQTVKNKLNRAGYHLNSSKWTDRDTDRLCEYYRITPDKEFNIMTLAEELKRPYHGIAIKASRMGISNPRSDHRQRGETYRTNLSVGQKKRVADHGASFKGKSHSLETRAKLSRNSREWHKINPHPRGFLGGHHSIEAKEKIAQAHRGKKIPRERVDRMQMTKAKNGTLYPKRPHGSWKSDWVTIGGKRFYARSSWEANYGHYLEFLKNKKEIKDWEHEPETFWFHGIKRGVCSYLPDFRVTTNIGAVEYHEVKGWMDAKSKTKIARMAKYHPKIKLIIIDSARYKGIARIGKSIVPGWATSPRKNP